MKYILGVLFSLFASAAFAACPGGSTCTQYNGTVPYAATGGSSTRTPATRATDQGINVLEFGADPTGVADSTAAIQATIDYAFTHNNAGGAVSAGSGVNSVFCPAGIYKVSYPIFFDVPNNMRGSAAAYSAGTTYASGNVVTFNGIPWRSLSSGNIGHTPTTGTGVATFWTPTTVSVSSFSFSATFRGVGGLVPGGNRGASCQFQLTYNNAPGFWSAPGNGVLVENLTVIGPNVSNGPGHQCGLPGSGAGIGIPGGGGGANRTKLVNVGAINMYAGITAGDNVGGSALGAENALVNPYVGNACLGIALYSAQNYINDISNADVCATTGLFMNTSSQGVTINGGNWSCGAGSTHPATSFAMSSVSASMGSAPTITVTATLTLAGDGYMVNTCASVAACASNAYNAWAILTTHFGVIPFELASFNSGTGAATFTSLSQWNQLAATTGMGDIATEINAISTIYASEMLTVFDGSGISATNIHIENTSGNHAVPTRLIKSAYGFGNNRANVLTDVYFNYDLNSNPPGSPAASDLASFYAQQTFDFITVDNVDLTINSITFQSQADYLNVSFGRAKFVWNAGPVALNHRPLMYSQSNNHPFTSDYAYYGTPGLGFGYFSYYLPYSITLNNDNVTGQASPYGWAQTPSVGYRPAPWASPCIAPSQYADLLSPPAITNAGPPAYTVSYPLIYGGQQYRLCDWNMTLSAYAGGTTYSKGDLVTSGGTTYFSRVNSNTGNTPASSPTQWGAFHYGFTSAHFGWSYGQNLTTTNVPSLAWNSRGRSFSVYVTDSSGKTPTILFPGLALVLTGTGGAGCPATAATFMIVGVHRYLGYVDVVNAVNSTPSYNPWGSGNQCTGTTIAQPAYSFVNLN